MSKGRVLTGLREGGIGAYLWVSLEDEEHDDRAGDAVELETVMQIARANATALLQ